MRQVIASIIIGVAFAIAAAQPAKAIIPVLVDGAPTLEVLHTTANLNDALNYLKQAADWVDSLNNQLTQIDDFVNYLEMFGNPANIVSMVGLDSVVGGDGVIGTVGKLGGELFQTYGNVQSLAAKGMDLYQIGQGVAGGDWQSAMRMAGLSNVIPLAQASQVFNAQNASLTGAGNYVRQAQAAMTGMSGAVMQAKTAKTASEIGKASTSQAAQAAAARQAMDQAFLDQQIVQNQFSSQEAMQSYLANAERNSRVRADNKAGFFAPAADAQVTMNGAAGSLSSTGAGGNGSGNGNAGGGNGPVSKAIANRVGESTAGIAGTDGGNKACAWAVNSAFEQATGSPIATGGDQLSVVGTVAAMEAQPDRFREVSRAEAVASGSDYVVASNPEWGSNGSHIGIGNGSEIWSNSSSKAAIAQNFDSNTWGAYFGSTRYFVVVK